LFFQKNNGIRVWEVFKISFWPGFY